jgi:4'-phosphopantetheinyl transferase
MMEIHALRIEPSSRPEHFARLLETVGPAQRERICRFRRREDALRCLFGDLLVRAVLIRTSGFRNRDLVFSRAADGKPVCSAPGGLHFNLSHSGCWILAAFDDLPVGLDVEKLGPVDPGVPELVLSPAEMGTMIALPEPRRRPYFFETWTIKESWLKAEGRGMTGDLPAYSVSAAEEPFRYRLRDNQTLDGAFLSLLPGFDPDYRAAVCAARDDALPSISYESPDRLATLFIRDPL